MPQNRRLLSRSIIYKVIKWCRRNKKKINPKVKHKRRYSYKENKHGTRPVKIPESVKWAIQHPYQGGGVSPKKIDWRQEDEIW